MPSIVRAPQGRLRECTCDRRHRDHRICAPAALPTSDVLQRVDAALKTRWTTQPTNADKDADAAELRSHAKTLVAREEEVRP